MQHSGISKSTKWPALAQPLSSPLRCSRSEKYVLAGQTKPGEFPEARLSPDFLTTYGVLGRMPILIYIYFLLQALPEDRRYPDPLISHKPFLMVRLRIADQPRQRAHGQRGWVLFRVADM